jgi:hypothetical protein
MNVRRSLPVYPDKQMFSVSLGMSHSDDPPAAFNDGPERFPPGHPVTITSRAGHRRRRCCEQKPLSHSGARSVHPSRYALRSKSRWFSRGRASLEIPTGRSKSAEDVVAGISSFIGHPAREMADDVYAGRAPSSSLKSATGQTKFRLSAIIHSVAADSASHCARLWEESPLVEPPSRAGFRVRRAMTRRHAPSGGVMGTAPPGSGDVLGGTGGCRAGRSTGSDPIKLTGIFDGRSCDIFDGHRP